MILLAVFLCSFLSALLLVPCAIKISAALKAFKPKENRLIAKPCLGGIGIYSAFFLTLLLAAFFINIYNQKIVGLFSSSTLILIVGLVDDLYDISPFLKIIGQFFGALILILFGVSTKIIFLPIWLNVAMTIIWVLFITNAFNLLDIMDGLSSGLVVIISSTLLIIAIINKDIFSSVILMALIGAHLGFLKYNYPPAKVYMGDTGSLFSGFLLAALAINISYAPLDRKAALLSPILAMSLPIYDTFFLILMRLKKNKPIFNKTRDHFALRLLTMGYSLHKSMWIMYFFSIFLAASAITVAFSSNVIGYIVFSIVILVFILMGKSVGMVRVHD